VRLTASALIIWAFCLLPFFASAQLINERFEKLLVSENFDSINTYWTTMANADNLFIVQDGEYILQRKATTAPFAVIANFEENYSNFKVVTSVKLDKTLSETGFAGLLFMMQAEGAGGFLIELNKVKEYRLRQIVDGSYKYITGSSKTGGWIKSNELNEAGHANMIEVRNLNRSYDLYLNNKFVMSFSEPTYKSGQMGVIVGPATRCKIDFMYIFTKVSPEEMNLTTTAPADSTNVSTESPDMIQLAESIIILKTQINKLNEENDGLRKTISAMKSGDQEKDVTIKNYEKQVKALQDQAAKKEQTLDSLNKKNNELMKFKEMAGGNENGDLIIVLSKSLKSEKEKNAALEKEIKELREKNGAEKPAPVKSGTKSTKSDTGSTGQKDSSKKDPAVIKLPEEN